MKKTLLFLCLGSMFVTNVISQNLLKKVDNNHYLELAYYSIKSDKSSEFTKLQKKTFAVLSKQPGFISTHSYKDVANENTFIDLVIWESLEDANTAETNFVKLEEFSEYNKCLEKIHYYSHGQLVKNGQIGMRSITDNSILEFVAYSIKDGEFNNYVNSRPRVFNHLEKTYNGFRNVKTWQSVEDQKVVIDLAFWSTLEIAKKAFQESAKNPIFDPFNKTLEQIKFYGDFKKVF